ncbi:hypothetical protein GCM10010191_89170 [Actinomadura vinacea]|uniref:DUF4235 domain-containing protein n=1 Tax=Actinomadura vinacea TaxID=115336 RepID=A0ABN3KCY3_9ACTN
MKHLNAVAVLIAITLVGRLEEVRENARNGSDRGASVVETIILVAGFAGLAFTIYLAVKGKVHNWINKIPG